MPESTVWIELTPGDWVAGCTGQHKKIDGVDSVKFFFSNGSSMWVAANRIHMEPIGQGQS